MSFLKKADCEFLSVVTEKKAATIFDEIVSAHAQTLADASVADEGSPIRHNYLKFRAIAEKKANRLAISTRAISAHETWGPNKNGDAFERPQLEKFHKTFVLKPHLWDHKLEIPYVRGIIADAAWNKEKDYVETLIFIDRETFPKYATNVEKGIVNSFSMGVEVKEAECSICQNIAQSPRDLCEHATSYKGLTIHGKKVFEYNRDLEFIEQSAVASPADPHSHTISVFASLKGSRHADIERLQKLAAVLNSYTTDDKNRFPDEYFLIESTTARLADRVARDLNIIIDPRRGE